MNTDRAALVGVARDAIARGSRSFFFASRLFDRTTREHAWLLYAWCRACDDLADGQSLGDAIRKVDDPAGRMTMIRSATDAVLAGRSSGRAAFDALGLVIRECAIPHRFPRDLVDGFALDAAGWRPASQDDLLRYCYHVAGVVGIMMAIVMGVPADADATLDCACDLGIAFQLANIARDLVEDLNAGRCYLPASWLHEEGVTAVQLRDAALRDTLARLARRLAALATPYRQSARGGIGRLPYRSAWAVLAADGIYGGIAEAVVRRGPQAWDQRVTTGGAFKLYQVARAAVGAARRARSVPSRADLWSRPAGGALLDLP